MHDQNVKIAERIVDGIVSDLANRRGLRQEWERMDDNLEIDDLEIIKTWKSIVLTELARINEFEITRWINVYRHESGVGFDVSGTTYDCESQARQYADHNVISTLPFTIRGAVPPGK